MDHGIKVSTVNISCPDPAALARFYAALLHLEIQVNDLQGALEHALACGARLADHQPQDDVRVCLDPAGHPFCLWLDETG